MSVVGPELPPHLAAKRKRKAEEQDEQPIPVRAASYSPSPSSDAGQKRRRVLGPTLPPAPLDERPAPRPETSDCSDSDDDVGPALPPEPGDYDFNAEAQRIQAIEDENAAIAAKVKLRREEWMLVPPKQDDWSSRIDPTKLKNRKFNTGRGAKGPAQMGGADNTIWTETPDEKRKRLEDEVMGVKKPAHLDHDRYKSARSEAKDKETERRIREYNVGFRPGLGHVPVVLKLSYKQEKNRISSLYDEHKKATPKENEDDPSKRAFDKEKDIGGGLYRLS